VAHYAGHAAGIARASGAEPSSAEGILRSAEKAGPGAQGGESAGAIGSPFGGCWGKNGPKRNRIPITRAERRSTMVPRPGAAETSCYSCRASHVADSIERNPIALAFAFANVMVKAANENSRFSPFGIEGNSLKGPG
jgi:hypothetical protein